MTATPERDRTEQLRSEIAARLRRVCAHLSDEQFTALVEDIAGVTLKYDEKLWVSPFVPPKHAD